MNHIDIFQNHFKTVFPELFFLLGITIILIYGVIYSPLKEYKYPVLIRSVGWLSIQTLFFVILLITNQNIPYASIVIFNNVLILDDFTTIIKIIILLSALSSILISFDYLKGQKINSFEYLILILISTLSMLFIVSSYDLISLYLAIELQSLSFYVLAAFQRNNEFSTEAGLKYFILGALSSGFLLFGESILYGFTGITNFEELTKLFALRSSNNLFIINDECYIIGNEVFTNKLTWEPFGFFTTLFNSSIEFISTSTNAILIGLLFILIAFLFKIAAAPFHMWTPDVYEGAPTSVTAFFSITPKIAILALFLRLCLYTFYDLIESWQIIIIACSFLSMYIGTFGAINQNKIKRLFAYSSIAHVGYMLIGLATGTVEAIESLLLYITIYIIMMLNVFGILLILAKEDWNTSARHFINPNIQSNTLNVSNTSQTINNVPYTPFWNISYIYKLNSPTEIVSYNSSLNSNINANIELNSAKHTFCESNSTIARNFKDIYLKASNPLWDPYQIILPNTSFSRNYAENFITQNKEVTNVIFDSLNNSAIKTQNNKENIMHYTSINCLTRIKKKNEYIKYITDLCSLSKTNPLLASTLAILFFSNAGVPPLAGFYGKLNIFLAAVEGSMYFLALAGVICSVIGAFYSIRLIKIIYYHNISKTWLKWSRYKPISKENSIILGITLFFTLFFFLYPSFLWTLTHSAALSLCL